MIQLLAVVFKSHTYLSICEFDSSSIIQEQGYKSRAVPVAEGQVLLFQPCSLTVFVNHITFFLVTTVCNYCLHICVIGYDWMCIICQKIVFLKYII